VPWRPNRIAVSASRRCSRRPHGSQTTERTGTRTSDRVSAIAGHDSEQGHENEEGTQARALITMQICGVVSETPERLRKNYRKQICCDAARRRGVNDEVS
jgi:hypothetical protein